MSSPSEISLSIAETNKLRAQWGLPLLELTEEQQRETGMMDSEMRMDAALESKNQPENNDELRQKLASMKQNREKLRKWKGASGLGDDDEADDVNIWVQSHKDLGVSHGRKRTSGMKQNAANDDNVDLPVGLKVRHDKKFIEKGKETILTLRDSTILSDAPDELENVDLARQEQTTWNEKKRRGEGLYAYVDALEENVDVDVLPKYDEANMRNVPTKSFELKARDEDDETKRDATLVKLSGSTAAVPSDVLTIEEMKKRRKSKKSKRSMRKRKREEIEGDAGDSAKAAVGATAPAYEVYATEANMDERKATLLEQEKQRRLAYNSAMQKAQDISDLRLAAMDDEFDADDALLKLERRRKRRRVDNGAPPGAPVNVIDRTKSLEQKVKQEDSAEGATISYEAGTEFLPDLGAPEEESTVTSALREKLRTQPKTEVEEETTPAPATIAARKSKTQRRQTSAQDVAPDDANNQRRVATSTNETTPISTTLLKEPILDRGVYTAIVFARQKGILKRYAALEEESRAAQSTTRSKRDEFKKLNYAFYGMRKSKSKLEREKKKLTRIKRMESMSATDTPFNAAQALRSAQEASGSAFIQIGKSLDALSTAAAAHRLSKQKRKEQQQQQ